MKLILDDGFEIPFEKVFVAEVTSGAVLILEHPGILARQTIFNIESIFTEKLGLKTIVLTEGLTVKCILKTDNNLQEGYK